MTVTGIDLLLTTAGFIILLVAEHAWRWNRRDKKRRLERLRKRGLA